jgi:hypothetical protein
MAGPADWPGSRSFCIKKKLIIFAGKTRQGFARRYFYVFESFLGQRGFQIVKHLRHRQIEESFLMEKNGASIGQPNGMLRFAIASPKQAGLCGDLVAGRTRRNGSAPVFAAAGRG